MPPQHIHIYPAPLPLPLYFAFSLPLSLPLTLSWSLTVSLPLHMSLPLTRPLPRGGSPAAVSRHWRHWPHHGEGRAAVQVDGGGVHGGLALGWWVVWGSGGWLGKE